MVAYHFSRTHKLDLFMSEAEAVGPGKSADDSDVVIETRNLSKVYRDFWGRQKVQALKALDLSLIHI